MVPNQAYDRPGFDSRLCTPPEIPLLSSSSEDLEWASTNENYICQKLYVLNDKNTNKSKEWHQTTRKKISRNGEGKWGLGIRNWGSGGAGSGGVGIGGVGIGGVGIGG